MVVRRGAYIIVLWHSICGISLYAVRTRSFTAPSSLCGTNYKVTSTEVSQMGSQAEKFPSTRVIGLAQADRRRGQRRALRDGMSNGGGSQESWSCHVSDVAAARYRYGIAVAVTTAQHDNQYCHNHPNPLTTRSVSFPQSPLAPYSPNVTAELTNIPITGSAVSDSVPGDSLPPPQPLTLAKGRSRAKTWLPRSSVLVQRPPIRWELPQSDHAFSLSW